MIFLNEQNILFTNNIFHCFTDSHLIGPRQGPWKGRVLGRYVVIDTSVTVRDSVG